MDSSGVRVPLLGVAIYSYPSSAVFLFLIRQPEGVAPMVLAAREVISNSFLGPLALRYFIVYSTFGLSAHFWTAGGESES